MKIKIKPYIIASIKENVIYILIFFVSSLFSFIFVGIVTAPKIFANNEKINQLSKEIQILKNRKEIIGAEITDEKIDLYIKFLNTMIPQEENYFSIIYALEKISQDTGFTIKSFKIDLKASKQGKLKLSIDGYGNKESFLNFLKKYKFFGGRLITAEDITLSEEDLTGNKIDLNFYSMKIEPNVTSFTDTQLTNLSKDLSEIESLTKKINFSFKSEEDNNKIENYPKKTNPF